MKVMLEKKKLYMKIEIENDRRVKNVVICNLAIIRGPWIQIDKFGTEV